MMMMENNKIYVITEVCDENKIIGYANSESEAKKFCEDRELYTGKIYTYYLIHNIDSILNPRPKALTFKAYYDISKEMLDVIEVDIFGINKNYESDWPIIEKDKEDRKYFYFTMDIDSSDSKRKIINDAKIKADELLNFNYNNNIGFMHFVNKQILLKEGVI